MQILAETEYQDLYRVMDGVLLVVNKFEPIMIPGTDHPYHLYTNRIKTKKYHKNCQDALKVLTADYYDQYNDLILYKGSVLYHNKLVQLTDPYSYQFQIKTTGDSFSGDARGIEDSLCEILYRIRQGRVRK